MDELMEGKPTVKKASTRLANVVFVAATLICAVVVGYFFYHYQWLHDRHFSGAGGMALYYGAPIFLIVVSCGALLLDPEPRIMLAAVVLSLGISVYLMEGLLKVRDYVARTWPTEINGQNYAERATIAKRFGVDFDRRSRLDVLHDLRREGMDAVTVIEPSAFWKTLPDGSLTWNIDETGRRPFPLGGISNKTTVFCNEIGKWTIYQSDEHGFRNSQGAWNQPPDIVAVGDSLAHGACIPSDGHFMGLIHRTYGKTLNLAMTGMGPLSELAALKEYAQAVRPKILLWVYSEATDVTDLAAEEKNSVLMQYRQGDFSQHLLSRQRDIDQEWTQIIENAESGMVASLQRKQQQPYSLRIEHQVLDVLLLSRLRQRLGLIHGATESMGEKPSEVDPNLLAMFGKILSEAKKTTEDWGGSMYFVYLPEWVRYAHPEAAAKNRDLVLKIVKELGIHLIDLGAVIARQPDNLALFPLRGYGHYSEAGNRLIAGTILSSIPDSLAPNVMTETGTTTAAKQFLNCDALASVISTGCDHLDRPDPQALAVGVRARN